MEKFPSSDFPEKKSPEKQERLSRKDLHELNYDFRKIEMDFSSDQNDEGSEDVAVRESHLNERVEEMREKYEWLNEKVGVVIDADHVSEDAGGEEIEFFSLAYYELSSGERCKRFLEENKEVLKTNEGRDFLYDLMRSMWGNLVYRYDLADAGNDKMIELMVHGGEIARTVRDRHYVEVSEIASDVRDVWLWKKRHNTPEYALLEQGGILPGNIDQKSPLIVIEPAKPENLFSYWEAAIAIAYDVVGKVNDEEIEAVEHQLQHLFEELRGNFDLYLNSGTAPYATAHLGVSRLERVIDDIRAMIGGFLFRNEP